MKLASDPKNVDKVPPPLKAAHMFASHSVFLYLFLSSRVLHLGFGGCVGMPGMPIGLTQPGHLGTWVPGYLGTWVPGYLGT